MVILIFFEFKGDFKIFFTAAKDYHLRLLHKTMASNSPPQNMKKKAAPHSVGMCLSIIFYVKSRYREEQNLTRCWICFFYSNLCFLWLSFIQRTLSIPNGPPLGVVPLCLRVKPKHLCSERYPDPVHLSMPARKRKLRQPLLRADHFRRYLQAFWPFYFTSSRPPLLFSERSCEPACSVKSDSLWPRGLWPTSLLCPWGFPGKNTGVGCHALLQGFFLTQR